MRHAAIERKTHETTISVQVDLDGRGTAEIATGIGFFDHMLLLLARHSQMDLVIRADGDLVVDDHHTVEDIGIVLGQACKAALGSKQGICRYGDVRVPMDEALAEAVLDLSGRPFLVFSARFSADRVGAFATQMTEEFFRAFTAHAGVTLHLSCIRGHNDHHMIEAMFKAFARSLRQAVAIDPEAADEIPSTKGTL